MPQHAFQRIDGSPRCLEIADCRLEFGEGQLIAIDLRERELVGTHARRGDDGAERLDDTGAAQEALGVGEFPPTRDRPRAVARQYRGQYAARPFVDTHAVQRDRRPGAADGRGIDQIIAVANPYVRSNPGIFRNLRIFDLLPGGERRGRARHDPFVEAEADRGDEQRGEEQRRQHLMRRHARRLHRDDLAVLVERDQRQDRPEQDGEGQKGFDDLRQAQPDIAPHVAVAVARDRQDLAALAQQVERLEHQHEREQDREAAYQKQPPDIERHGSRRKEMELVHRQIGCCLRWNRRMKARIFCPALAATRSSAPIG